MVDTDELNRLVGLGIPLTTALEIISGERDEVVETERCSEKPKVEEWVRSADIRVKVWCPVWDCDPSRFYLALDGVKPSEVLPKDYVIVDIEVTDLKRHLQCQSSRDKDPWSPQYSNKTAGIAYRWSKGRGVTPPVISPFNSDIVIEGGMHRFHLADHYGAKQLPALVKSSDLGTIKAILASACPRCREVTG